MTEDNKQQSDIEFAPGISIKHKNPDDKDNVLANVELMPNKFSEFLASKDSERVYLDIFQNKNDSTKYHARVNDYNNDKPITVTKREGSAPAEDSNFINGLFVSEPSEAQQEKIPLLKLKISINRGEVGDFLDNKDEKVMLQVRKNPEGKVYAIINNDNEGQKQHATTEVKQEVDDKPVAPSMSMPF